MRTFVGFSLAIGISLCASPAFAQNYVPSEVIVKIKRTSGPSAGHLLASRLHAEKGFALKNHWAKLNLYHYVLPGGQSVDAAIKDLSQHPDVEYVEPNFIVKKASSGGVVKRFSAQDAPVAAQSNQVLVTGANIGLAQIYSNVSQQGGYSGQLSARPIIAVIDTGLDTTHYVMEQTQAVWTNPGEIANNQIDDDGNGYVDDVHGWNFVSNSGTMYDDDGHGTHVSGIILSVDQNIFASPLVTSKIQIMPLKFLDATGSGATSDAIKAIYYAIDKGATVLNNSWGGADYSTALNEAIAYSYSNGASFVAAAGNAGADDDTSPMYPADYDVPNVISVAAVTDTNTLASFSNWGRSSVALGSPGVYILSTLPGGEFGEMSGTSMATPFVAGTAIQMKAQSPHLLGHQVRSLIMAATTQASNLNGKVVSNGILNSDNSINASQTAVVETTQPAYQITYQPDRTLASGMTGGGCGLVSVLNDRQGPPDQGLGAIAVIAVLALAPLAYLYYRRWAEPSNRRRYERFRISSEVRIHVGDKELVGAISTISLGGARVDTSALLQNGGLVTLTIASPTGDEKVEVQGHVVWSEANKSYGVAFDHAPQTVLNHISRWTKVLQRAS